MNCTFLYSIVEYDPLLDSSNMFHDHWIRIAGDIENDYDDYDGFIVLHGTDTLAYTASALSFMLNNLMKPVIIMGSMIPIFEVRSDALNNIICSLILNGCFSIKEVTVFSDYRLLRGNRCTKVSTESLHPFNSLNYPPLAVMTMNEEVNINFVLSECSNEPFFVDLNLDRNVIIVPIYPGIQSCMLFKTLQPPVSGVVLQCFGSGNIPTNSELIEILKNAVKQEILIVRISLCPEGSVSDSYATGIVLAKAGVIAGNDMTTEATYTKLCWVLAKDLSFKEKCELMKCDLRGEMSAGVKYKYH